jgi:hypothetical protein
MNNNYTWRQEQQMLEDSFARSLLIEYNIKEVTTQRQAKNGTRQFLLPTGQMLASYKTGYVRRCDSSDRIWQLNPKYKRKVKYVFLTKNGLETREDDIWSRALIYSGLARLNFLLNYYLKNYKSNTNKNR